MDDFLLPGEVARSEGALAPPPPAPTPDFDFLLPGELPAATRAASTVRSVLATDPDKAAQAKALGTAAGLPTPVVERNFDAVAEQEKLRQIQGLMKTSPLLARQLTDPEFAKLAHDDTKNLSLVETFVNSFKRGVPGLKQIGSAIALKSSANMLNSLDAIEGRMAAGVHPAFISEKEDPYSLARMPQEERTLLRSQLEAAIPRRTAAIAGYEAEKRAIPQAPIVAEVMTAGKGKPFVEGMGLALNAFRSAPLQFIAAIGPESLITSAPGLIAGGVLGATGNPMGAAAAVGLGSFATDYGSTILEAMGSEGVDINDPKAIEAAAKDDALMQRVGSQAFRHAAIVGPVDAVSGGLASKLALPKQLATSLATRPITREVAGMATKTLAEGALGGIGEAGGELAAGQDLQPGNILAEIVGEATTAPVEVMSIGAKQMHERIAQAKQATENAAVFTQLDKVIAANKVRERSPADFHQFAEQAAADGPVQDVYIDAKAVAQILEQSGVEPSQLPPVLQAQLHEALASGGDVIIPFADYATHVAGTEMGTALLPHLRASADAMSQVQAEDYYQNAHEEFKQTAEKIMAEKAGDTAFHASGQVVEDTITAELAAANRFTSDVNTAYAGMVRDFYKVNAVKFGITPEAMYARYPLHVQAESVAGGQTLQQEPEQQVRQAIDVQYPQVGEAVDGRTVRDDVPNQDSIAASLGEHETLPGIREVSFASFTQMPELRHYSVSEEARTKALAEQIKESGELDPLIVVIDKEGPYILEGAHRFDALRELGAKSFPAKVVLDLESLREGATFFQSVSTRVPTGKKSTENPLSEMLVIGLPAAKLDPKAFEKNVDLLTSYSNYKPAAKAKTTDQKAERFINHVRDNLLWLHDQVAPLISERSKLWYDGARQIVDRWSLRFGLTDVQTAGIFAVLSPQKDWYMNVSLGERVMDAMKNHQDTFWSPEMTTKSKEIWNTPEHKPIFKAVKGKTLVELKSPIEKAMWIRTYDEAHNSRGYRLVLPEGGFGAHVLNTDGVTPSKVAWGPIVTIAKAVSIFENGAIDNVSQQLGEQHKVRNFYNNLFDPNDAHGSVTIDTHAVAAGLLRPLSGTSIEVAQNFGGTGSATSSNTGANGTYAFYAEAYRRAAEARNILPREMQSITWEAVRGLFSPGFKAQASNVEATAQLWDNYRDKGVSINETRKKISALAGGIVEPDWVGSPAGLHEGKGDSSYQEEVPSAEPPRGGAGSVPGRAGAADTARAAGQVSAGSPGASSGADVTSSSFLDSTFFQAHRPTFTPAMREKVMAGQALFQPAYHGGPHDIGPEGFSTSKIGTGEGAQAYGWGLYFAENPNIATSYHRNLAGDAEIEHFSIGKYSIKQGEKWTDYSPRDNSMMEQVKGTIIENLLIQEHELRTAEATGKLNEYVLGVIDAQIEYYKEEYSEAVPAAEQFRKMAARKGAIKFTLGKVTGGVYQVDIPDEHVANMLLWDKSLSEQPEVVQKALAKAGVDDTGKEKYLASLPETARPVAERILNDTLANQTNGTHDADWAELQKMAPDIDHNAIHDIRVALPNGERVRADKLTGETLYRALSEAKGSDRAASELLNSLGVPGIKFLDFGSRGENKTPTHNLVVFDDKIITLTHKDGSPVTPQERKDYLQKAPDNTARGQISFPQGGMGSGPSVITLGKNADLSTFLHELGHFYLEVYSHLVVQPDAPAEIRSDFDALLKWFALPIGATWNTMSLDEKRPYHEQLARGFEAYLFEGKAPNVELQNVFARFRAWMLNVYKHLSALKVELTPEVRGVFDRMLATNEEIVAAEAARGFAPLFKSAVEAGMTAAEWQSYQALGQQATQDAVDQLQTRSLRDMQYLTNARGKMLKALQRDAAEKRKAVRREVEAEVMAEPINQVRQMIKQVEHRLSIPALEAAYPDGSVGAPDWRKLPRNMLGREGLSPDMVAEMYGYSSGDELVQKLLSEEPAREKIEGLTDQRMLERYGDLSNPAAIARAANEAIHNDARTRFVATELHALNKATGQRNILAHAAKQFAEAIVGRKKIRDIKPAQFAAAEARAARAADQARNKGNLVEAATEKRNQLVNAYATRAAYDGLSEAEKAVNYLKKFDREGSRKSLDIDYLDQIDKLLERFDLRKGQTLTAIDKRKTLTDWVKSQEDQGLTPVIDEALLNEASRKSYKDMTLEELRGLTDAVKNIEHLGRLKKTLLTAKDKREFDAVVADIEASIRDNAKRTVAEERSSDRGVLVSAKRLFSSFLASHRKFASQVRELDGWADGGPAWEYLIRNMNEAGNNEAVAREQATMTLLKMMAPLKLNPLKLRAKQAFSKEAGKTFYPQVGKSFSAEERVAIALNMGNATNIERLQTGERLSPAALQAILADLTPVEAKFVNETWALLESFRPQIAAKERRLTGVEPDWVEAQPFILVLKTGEKIPMTGGYYPIKYDPLRSDKSSADIEAEVAKQMTQGLYARSQTKRGHLKARTESTGRPMRYDLDVIAEHVSQVVHDLAWHEYLIDANRLLRSGRIENAVREHYGNTLSQSMKKTLTDIAQGEVGSQESLDLFMNHLRFGTTIVGLGFNVSNTLINIVGLTQSMSRIGTKWVAKGVVHWAGDAAKLESSLTKIYEKSDFMRLRGKTLNRELNEIRNTVSGESGKLKATYFWLQNKTQMIVDVPTWYGAYEKAMVAEDMSEAKAVALADAAVLDAQGGGQVKDLSGVQRGGPGLKLFTTFYSFFNTTYNLTAEAYGRTNFKKPGDVLLFAADLALLYTIPALLGTLVKAALKGDWEDEDKLIKTAIADQLAFVMGSMAFLREATFATQAATGVGSGMGYTGPASMRFLSDLSQLGVQAHQGEADAAFWKTLNNVAGAIFHYPAGQINRTVAGAIALAEGETTNPAALLVGHTKH